MMPPRTPYTYNFAHMCPGMYSGDPASRWVHQGSDMAHLQHILIRFSPPAPSRRSQKKEIVLEWLCGRIWAGLALRSRPMVPPDASEPAEPNKNDAMGHGYAERENCIQGIHVARVAGHNYANPK